MNVYLISTRHNGYDTYDSAVVLAESEEEARNTHPAGGPLHQLEQAGSSWEFADSFYNKYYDTTWVPPEEVKVELIARNVDAEFLKSKNNKVVCASFNAG